MSSLSKRSSAPGLRSGFAAGDRRILERFLLYRTYHGAGMSNAVQLASLAAWKDEAHVVENRRLYREKFAAFHARVNPVLPLTMPQAAFYFWAEVGGDDVAFARELFAATSVTVLPGSYISREAHGLNPGRGFVRMALVSTVEETLEAAERLHAFAALGPGVRGAPRAFLNDTTHSLQATIDDAFERRAEISPASAPAAVKDAVAKVLAELDAGRLRVAEKRGGEWITHQWIKKAVLLSFRLRDNEIMQGGYTHFYDKVSSKFANFSDADFAAGGYRVVPPAAARHGAFIAKNVVLMPSYVNIGAYVDEGTMVDTWATVGSCAQIGKNVHLSGGVGIGGVLEPLQANPTIIEDNCFIGARSEIVEGVIVEENSVVSMGVYIGQSTKIYNRATGEVSYGRVPPGAVVVSGNLPGPDGRYSLYCAVIIKQVDAKTRAKTGINELLRGD